MTNSLMTNSSTETDSDFHSVTPCLAPAELRLSGRLKVEPEDFVVEEIPAYEPSGAGEHLFLRIQKRDVSAESLIAHLATTLQISRDKIGVAGLKDRRAMTRQWVSVPAAACPDISKIETAAIQVLQTALHGNKLKTGHLTGNRFEIVLRNVEPDALERARQICSLIQQSGMPNYFGDQRFGIDGQTLTLGMSLLKGTASARKIPYHRRKFLLRLALSASQSALFNEVVRLRLERGILQQVQPGDVMQVRASGGLFVVEDAKAEQVRCDRKEIVITGPLFGPKMKSPLAEVFELEQQVLKSAGLTRDVFREHKKLTPGTRRPLIVSPECLQVDPDPNGLRLTFSLPSGSYATVLLREFLKSPAVE